MLTGDLYMSSKYVYGAVFHGDFISGIRFGRFRRNPAESFCISTILRPYRAQARAEFWTFAEIRPQKLEKVTKKVLYT